MCLGGLLPCAKLNNRSVTDSDPVGISKHIVKLLVSCSMMLACGFVG